VNVSVTVNGNFGFSSAPSPYATTNASGLPDLSIDSHTLTVYVNDNEMDTATRKGDQYSTQSTEITPTIAQLSSATVGHDPIGKGYLALPSDVEHVLTTDAEQITNGDTTAYQKAMSLENYFQNNFTYSLNPKITGTGAQAITSFLQNKAGFCQQFAATMAAMARALGIPAVVAEGYTPGTLIPGTDEYQVNTHDAHAWPMLYFDGVGWVQFEPTPSITSKGPNGSLARADQQPWTVAPTQSSGGATTQAGVTPTVTASGSAAKPACSNSDINRHVDDGNALPCSTANATATARPSTPFASWGAFGVLPRTFERWFLSGNAAQIAVKLLLLALVLVAGLPGAFRLRRWRRRRRLLRKAAAQGGRRPKLPGQRSSVTSPDGGSAESRFTGSAKARRELAFTAWEELREYATDLGYSWPESDTPRQLAGRLAGQAEFDQESSAAAGRVTTLVERAVYSPDPHIEAEEAIALPGDVSRVRSALAAAAGRAARLRAAVLPNSSIDHMLRRGKHH
jgi:transglutaminase-like putative cysteine protease